VLLTWRTNLKGNKGEKNKPSSSGLRRGMTIGCCGVDFASGILVASPLYVRRTVATREMNSRRVFGESGIVGMTRTCTNKSPKKASELSWRRVKPLPRQIGHNSGEVRDWV